MILELLIPVGVVCAINTVLAIILVLADARLGFGPCKLTINDDKDLTVPGGQPLLSTLKSNSVFIPSACGGRGSCGLCKVKVLEGGGSILATETPFITVEEQKDNVRLSCQVKIRRDLRIQIESSFFNVKQYATEVTEIRDLTHDIKLVAFKMLDPPEISFKPGQYVQLEIPAYALTREPIYRAYSVASDPSVTDRLELIIRHVPNGIATTYVHKHLKVGERIMLNGPYGDFYLRQTDAEMICIAGGSGMAPIRSILLDMARHNNLRRCRYYFGARARRDLFLVDELRGIEKQLPNFKFTPTLSGAETGDNWDGDTGLVTEIADREIADASRAEAYLCGNPRMIDACVALLKSKGMPESNIFYDKFA